MAARSRLPFYLAAAYTLLALYGSLYPLSGWRDTGADPLSFLSADWPRYVTVFDLTANVLTYLPLGFLWATVWGPRLPAAVAFLSVTLVGGLLSFGVEFAQTFLPSRVPSNADLVCNTLGVVLGAAAGLRWGGNLLDGGRLQQWRAQRFIGGKTGDRGLLLLALWLLAQLNPETFLFGNGNLRSLLGLPAAFAFDAGRFIEMEMATVAAHTIAIALIAGRLAHHRGVLFACVVVGMAMLVKTLALMVLMQGTHGLAWLSPGTLSGLAVGSMLALWALERPVGERQALAAMALMFATVLANLMPDNPYLEDSLRVWQQGHFLNFNGLTRLTSSLWPFLALPWLMLSRRNHERSDS